ncbi:CPBP family intramembrane metalloprotease [Streptomyces sp. T-3]|nr:CPBP family intramembrane metalloprotease [Streptomyces sp. T-3]
MDRFTVSPEFTTASTLISAALATYLVLGEPWLGRRMFASLKARRDGEPRALLRYYRFGTAFWAGFAALALLAFALSDGFQAADLGFGAPERPWFAAFLAAVLVFVALATGRSFHKMAREGKHVPGLGTLDAMLPRTGRERRYAAVTAVVSGVGTELVYRGLLIAFGVGVLGLNLYVAAAGSLVIYAAAGWYQGREGVLLFALYGALMTGLYFLTGSLVVPIVANVALCLRDLVLIPVIPGTSSAGSERSVAPRTV